MKFRELFFHILTFGSEKRTQNACKEGYECFLPQNIDPGLCGQKEGLHLSIPTDPGTSRAAPGGRGNKESSVGQRNPQNLLPALQGIKQKRKWSSTRQGLPLVASSAEGKPCPFHPTAPLCQQPPPWSMACLHSMVSTRGAWQCLSSALESELTSCSGRQKGHPFLCSGHSRYATSPPCRLDSFSSRAA